MNDFGELVEIDVECPSIDPYECHSCKERFGAFSYRFKTLEELKDGKE